MSEGDPLAGPSSCDPLGSPSSCDPLGAQMVEHARKDYLSRVGDCLREAAEEFLTKDESEHPGRDEPVSCEAGSSSTVEVARESPQGPVKYGVCLQVHEFRIQDASFRFVSLFELFSVVLSTDY
jgi:hypothetical protein